MSYKPVVLIILDGWGLSPSWGGNALRMNNPKNIDRLWREYPHAVLQALGAINDKNIVGESRLGHMLIGAGRNVRSSNSTINDEIKSRKFFKNKELIGAFKHAKENDSAVHLIGMISEGAIHADLNHLLALLEMADEINAKKVYIHAICDGVDSGPQDALRFIEKIQNKIKKLKIGEFATISGRFYAMDRDEHWERTRKTYEAMVEGKGSVFPSPESAIADSYRNGLNDELLPPCMIGDNKKVISDNDSVIFFNFREDRMKQLAEIISNSKFKTFLWKPKRPKNIHCVSFISYKSGLPCKIAFPFKYLENNLSEILSKSGLKQLKVAESEKSSHVTTFFNGGGDCFESEERKIISSPSVDSFDKKPEMSAYELTKVVTKAVRSNKYDFILVNFANVDMVAHSGNILAVGQAVEILDEEVEKIVQETLKKNGVCIITADHGNAEQMVNIYEEKKEKETLHTLNPVPFILVTPDNKKDLFKMSFTKDAHTLSDIITADSTLADVAPTVLEILGIPKPKEMSGRSLIRKAK